MGQERPREPLILSSPWSLLGEKTLRSSEFNLQLPKEPGYVMPSGWAELVRATEGKDLCLKDDVPL